MSSKARWLVAAAVVAGVVVAARYYGRQENESLGTIERSGPTGEVRRDGAPITEPVEPPATEALTDQDRKLKLRSKRQPGSSSKPWRNRYARSRFRSSEESQGWKR